MILNSRPEGDASGKIVYIFDSFPMHRADRPGLLNANLLPIRKYPGRRRAA